MELAPRLIDVIVPSRPAGVVLVLHGGASRSDRPMVSPTQLSVLRMVPIARRVARVGRRELAVFRLLNSRRGWDTSHTPVQDAHWALDQLGRRLGRRMPTCLVGHSLGGRAALLAADRQEVQGVVALAPWVATGDAAQAEPDARILIVHGSADRVAPPERSAAVARRLGARTRVTYVCVRGGRHAMLRRRRLIDGLAAQFAASTLLGRPPTGALAAVTAGGSWVEL